MEEAREPFKAVLTGDHAAMAKFTEKDWAEIVAVTHAGMSTDRLPRRSSTDWLPTAKHPALQAARTPSSSTSRCSR